MAQRLKAFCDPCEQELATELALQFRGRARLRASDPLPDTCAENAVGRFAYRDCIEILHHANELVVRLIPALRAEIEVRILEFMGDAHFALGPWRNPPTSMRRRRHERSQAWPERQLSCNALTSTMYPLGFIDPGQGVAAVEEAVKISMSANDPRVWRSTQMLAPRFSAGIRLLEPNRR